MNNWDPAYLKQLDMTSPEIVTKSEVYAILAERKKVHGDFADHAWITQSLKTVLWSHTSYMTKLNEMQREALEMIQHKIGRILAGDPHHIDHWDDIAGYATLVANALRRLKACADDGC